MNHLEPGVAGL